MDIFHVYLCLHNLSMLNQNMWDVTLWDLENFFYSHSYVSTSGNALDVLNNSCYHTIRH